MDWVPEEVVLLEPMFSGYSHAFFNASMIAAAQDAFPMAAMSFEADPLHTLWVQAAFSKNISNAPESVRWQQLSKPKLATKKWASFWRDVAFYRSLLKRHASSGRLLLFCAVSPTGLLALKVASWRLAAGCRVLAIVHCLAKLMWRRNRRPWNWVFNIDFVLRIPNARSIRTLALGQPILNRVAYLMPGLNNKLIALDIPRLPTLKKVRREFGNDEAISFAFIGGTRKGFSDFVDVSRSIVRNGKVRFVLAGHVNGEVASDVTQWVEGVGTTPLSQEELDRRVAEATYAIWTGNALEYGLTASATFADSMSVGTPVITLANDFIRYYFELYGHAGYLCDSIEDLAALVQRLACQVPGEEYARMCDTAARIAERFHPASVANRLREIVACS